eukprot:782340-Pelagomonas_calceolata.AAC.3
MAGPGGRGACGWVGGGLGPAGAAALAGSGGDALGGGLTAAVAAAGAGAAPLIARADDNALCKCASGDE